MGDFYTIGVSAVLSVTLIGAVRSYALRNAVIDHPTDRSSHTSAMPRGGGLGLIIAVVIAWTLDTSNWIPGTSLALVGVMVVGIVGWLDDHKPVRVGPRLIVHLISALCLIPLALQSNPVPTWMGYSAVVWWLFWGISAVNVVNFMDGIDGLIGSQMLVYGVHLAALGMTGESAHSLGLALAGGCAGFLFWNWTPARMFLGDVGSGALGLIAVLGGVLLLREGNTGLLAAFLPLYPLFLDATVTLLRRISGGERITL
ncbi:MAG: hypothetical protein VYD37_06870, partial [Gemmatimonadota bacterium]|nr:hypothetical protein [Gemmatimonadota bacterium]